MPANGDPRRPVRRMTPQKKANRLAYIDWMRGLACVLMFQTHAYDSWLSPEARAGRFYMWSQLLGTFPAPLFLFLAGVSFALVTDRLRQKGVPPGQIARQTILRGFEIYGLSLLFRVQEFALGWPWAPWTDLLRVDILNTIGLSMVLMGVANRLVHSWRGGVLAGIAVALGISLLTPPLWTTYAPRWLPWFVEAYINGQGKSWLFPLFPWTGFAFAGMAAAYAVLSAGERLKDWHIVSLLAVLGGVLIGTGRTLDRSSIRFYAVYDFWHTSPEWFLIRVGMLLLILFGVHWWCRLKPGRWFSPMEQLGHTSLLVYWVHIEFVYGRFSILPKRGTTIVEASIGLAIITLAMLALSIARTRLKGRGAEILRMLSRTAGRRAPA